VTVQSLHKQLTRNRESLMASNQRLLRIAVAVCPVCGQKTRNPKFCSRSCVAKLNNILVPKRRPGGRCCLCGSPVALRARYCAEHKPNKTVHRSQPLGAFQELTRVAAHRWSRVRMDARRKYHAAFPQKCVHCGYAKHIDVCHKRSLASFPDDTPLAVVNSLDNLVGLCPNCHWEFDHGLFQL